jgi:hypothetical protein
MRAVLLLGAFLQLRLAVLADRPDVRLGGEELLKKGRPLAAKRIALVAAALRASLYRCVPASSRDSSNHRTIATRDALPSQQ